jgi:hypothetical protein
MSSAKASADFRSRSAPTTSPTVDINSQGDNALIRRYEGTFTAACPLAPEFAPDARERMGTMIRE